MAECRSFVSFEQLLGPPGPGEHLPWESVCDAVMCLTVRSSPRWPHLRRALEAADLARLTTFLLSDGPCDLQGRPCDFLDACAASHMFVIERVRASGLRRVLILEDDVYFDVPALAAAVRGCARFLALDLDFSSFFFGGVYTELRATELPLVFSGRGVQAHAWLVDVHHPSWAGFVGSKHRMLDMFAHQHGEMYMVHPGVAFQRDFSVGETTRPEYNLAECPPLLRALAHVSQVLGMRNCWESCARRTNAIVHLAGSARGAVVGLVLIALLLFLATQALTRIKASSTWRSSGPQPPTCG